MLGAGELLKECGKNIEMQLEGDSSAAKGTLSREGAGRVKHLEVRQLWLQQYIKDGRIGFHKVPRAINRADTQTKHWSADAWDHFSSLLFSTF